MEIARLLVEAGAEVPEVPATAREVEADPVAPLSVTVSSPARRADV